MKGFHHGVPTLSYHTLIVPASAPAFGVHSKVAGLMAVYIVGLLLLDGCQNGIRIAGWLPARAHHALNRLLRMHPVSMRAWMGRLIQWARGLGRATWWWMMCGQQNLSVNKVAG